MQSQVSEISPVLVEVKVEVPWDQVHRDLETGFTKLARTAHVKGFRPGKVPVQVVKQLFRAKVENDVVGAFIEKGLLAAVEEHKLMLAAQPEVDAPEITKGEPLSIKARVEVRPKIEKVEIAGLSVYRSLDAVKDADVDAEVERLRTQHADIQVPDPMRPAKEHDVLTIDYAVSIDGEDKPEMKAEDRQVELGGGRLLPEFEKALLGAVPGDSRVAEVTYGEDAQAESLRGKTAKFSITVKELKEKVLPELDDEFAKDCGDYETLADLRAKLRKQLEDAAERRSETAVKDQLVDKLVEKNPVPVPPSMVKNQKQQMMYEFAQFLQFAGAGGLSPEMFDGIDERAERRVRAGLLLSAIARLENLDVTEADVEAKFEELSKQTGKHVAKIRVDYQGERRETLESQILEGKIMAFLRGKAELLEGHPPAEASAEGGEAKAEGDAEAAPATEKKTKKSSKKKGEEG
ncbi:MAG: trigger factor [Polyangiales bacterium]